MRLTFLTIFGGLICLLMCNQIANGLKCFTCIDAASNEECNDQGKIMNCALNEGSCQNEVRLSENKFRITKRCKQSLACENNQAQNERPAWDPTQCNPKFTQNSVCKCCCYGDYCNEKAMPCDNNPQCAPASPPINGEIVCTNMTFLASVCKFFCNEGFELIGPAEAACREYPRGFTWDAETPTCRRARCSPADPQGPENGQIKCSDSSKTGSQCIFDCNLGFTLHGSFQVSCDVNGKWSNSFPRCTRVVCDSLNVDALNNGQVTCSDGVYHDSICEYTCSEGYRLVGSYGTMCQPNGEWTNEKPQCQRITCPIDLTSDIEYGNTACSEINDFSSACSFTCNVGFFKTGPDRITCQETGQWSDVSAACQQITCDREEIEIKNGEVHCTKENLYSSECSFECFPGYYLEGAPLTVCQDFQWSNSSPQCLRASCQPELTEPVDGSIDCNEGSLSFSRCQYTCGDDSDKWDLFGVEESSCQLNAITNNFEWTNASTPCCARRCPPHGRVDLFLVLDSSSSVGRENWNKTVYFIKDIIDQFIISPDDVLVAAIRYNRYVDTASEIHIGQYTTSEDITKAILDLPYDGSGTFTGNALDYVLNAMLKAPMNRVGIDDLVVVVTDGVSNDDVLTPARKLREAGINILALGVVNEGGTLERDYIVDIAGDAQNAVLIESGFEGLSLNVTGLIQEKVCGRNPCQ